MGSLLLRKLPREPGKNNTSGMFTQNPFTVLNNTSNSSLHAIIIDLDLEVVNIDEQLDVLKLEKLARAAVAEANYKHFIESQKARDAPQNEDGVADLTMEVISNEQRNCVEYLSM